jgi:subtilisin family serine protease
MERFIIIALMLFMASAVQAVFSSSQINIDAPVPGEFIVVLTSPKARNLYEDSASFPYSSSFTIGETFQAYLYKNVNASRLAILRKNPSVKYVEANGMLHAMDVQPSPPSWGLKRASQRILPMADEYVYPSSAGEGVRAYIVDTGIYLDHQDFGGRAEMGVTTNPDGGDADCNGHGTHVAGTVGGTQYGIAKKATLIHVKVLGCGGSGSFAQIIEGIDWSVRDNAARGTKITTGVINLSLGGGVSQTVNDAVDAAFAEGILSAVAAGNDNMQDACTKSPASANRAYTVAAADVNDNPASFTNIGSCVQIWAPGVSIISAYIGSPTESRSLSGTSMSAPHVAGVAALLLAKSSVTLSPSDVAAQLTDLATRDQILYPLMSYANTSNIPVVTDDNNECVTDRDCGITSTCCPGQFGPRFCIRIGEFCCGDQSCSRSGNCCDYSEGSYCCASRRLNCCPNVRDLCCPTGWTCNLDGTCTNPLFVVTPNFNLFNDRD